MSGRMIGKITISVTHFFAKASPAMSSHCTYGADSSTSFWICSMYFGSMFL